MKKVVETRFEIDDLKAIRIGGKLFDYFYGKKGYFKDIMHCHHGVLSS